MSLYIGGKILGPIFGFLGRTIVGQFSRKLIAEEAVVAIGELTGKGYTASQIAELFVSKESDVLKIIYRGLTGSESNSGALFLAEEAEYAASFAAKGNVGAKGFAIPSQNFEYMIKEGLIKTMNDVNAKTGQKGLEYMITNPAIKQQVLKAMVKVGGN
ncbi:hypothetical protein IM792_16055 [Mucilaginibacter sp. JRF]|uniref:hypothetical protein n=1 Tax=Mucilaginibacter sp. JRF TaxID=2780088 RepID=UPI00187F1533|nr:hypothetical protein [Mucilaginibacter sp. JRF]MBE9585968.1 hypothetical protein [Mucilaginibacter sp. JRF]